MIHKLIYRTFVAGAVLFGICVLSVVIAAFLVYQQPAFYAELSDQGEADPAIASELEQKTRDFEEWARKSVSLSTVYVRDASTTLTSPWNDKVVSETHRLQISECQLNSVFTSNRFSAGDLRNPRVQIQDQQLRVGAEIHLGDSCLIFSANLKPLITPEGALQLEIMNARVGSLPFPLHTLLNLISQHTKLSDSKLKMDFSGTTPVLTLNISKPGSKSPSVKSVSCVAGSMAIEFQAPIAVRSKTFPDEQLSNRSAATAQR